MCALGMSPWFPRPSLIPTWNGRDHGNLLSGLWDPVYAYYICVYYIICYFMHIIYNVFSAYVYYGILVSAYYICYFMHIMYMHITYIICSLYNVYIMCSRYMSIIDVVLCMLQMLMGVI